MLYWFISPYHVLVWVQLHVLRRDSFLRTKSGCLLELSYLFFQVMRRLIMIADRSLTITFSFHLTRHHDVLAWDVLEYEQGFTNIDTIGGFLTMHHTFYLPQKQNHQDALLSHPHRPLRQPWNCLPSQETAISLCRWGIAYAVYYTQKLFYIILYFIISYWFILSFPCWYGSRAYPHPESAGIQ